MFVFAALVAGSALASDGGVVVRLDYGAHLFLPETAVSEVARRDRDLAGWLDEDEGRWRLLPRTLMAPERLERLVGTGCGTAVVDGASTAALSDVGPGTHSDGEAWWVLPTGEPLIEQVRGRAALDPVPGCDFGHAWVATHSVHQIGARHYGLLIAPRGAVVDALQQRLDSADDLSRLRWARTLSAGVASRPEVWNDESALWDALLEAGEVVVVLPDRITAAEDLQRRPHPERGTEEWWVHEDSGAWVWPVPPEPATAAAD